MFTSYNNNNLATKGRANFLLKKSSVLNSNRKPPKKYQANYSKIVSFKEGVYPQNEDDPNEEEKEEEGHSMN